MNRDSILSVYSDARAEYTKQLCVFLVPAYFQFFTELLEKAKQSSEPKRGLWQFQNYLNEIHDWNMEKVNNEIRTINVNCGCDYLDDLLTAVFIAHTKVLTAIRLSSNNKKVEINIPKVEHFLFKVLCETSKLLWSSTYLFRDGISGIEKQQNYRNIEQLINEGIIQAVRSLVPVKSILKDFVNSDTNTQDEDEDDDEPPVKIDKLTNPLDSIPQPVLLNDSPADIPIESSKIIETVEHNETNVEPSEEPVITELQEPEMKELSITEPVIEPKIENQTIIINDKQHVRFGEFNAHFDSENPNESDMIYDSNEEVPDLEILDESGAPLSSIDFDSLDEMPQSITTDEYEELH